LARTRERRGESRMMGSMAVKMISKLI
jgi:hypothetical protein